MPPSPPRGLTKERACHRTPVLPHKLLQPRQDVNEPRAVVDRSAASPSQSGLDREPNAMALPTTRALLRISGKCTKHGPCEP
jgi:hypothetical protein